MQKGEIKKKKKWKLFKEKNTKNQLGDLEVLDEAIRKRSDWIKGIPRFIIRIYQWRLDRLNQQENATAFSTVSVSYAENMAFLDDRIDFIRRSLLINS